MSDEILVSDSFLYGVLSGDAVIQSYVGNRIHSHITNAHPMYPCVLYQVLSSSDARGPDGHRAFSVIDYEVFAIKRESGLSDIYPIASRIDFLLNGTVSDDGLRRIRVRRERPIVDTNVLFGVELYFRSGGVYRVYCSIYD